MRRLVHTAIHRFDERLCATIMQQLSLETRTQLDALLTVGVPEAREETLYLSSEELGREIQEGLNVIENWNEATNFIHFGRLGEFSTNTVEDQELAMLALHLLEIALTYIQTLMIQDVLSEPAWLNQMTKEDLSGLTPLIYSNVNPYGLIRLNMAERLRIERAEAV